jgi:DAK2 domain fusion protein YloV
LPVLKQAGVVDAGGKGLVYLFEAGAGALRGESPAQAAATNSRAVEFAVTEEMADIRFPYDAQFLIRDLRVPPEVVRTRLEPFGDSLLVVGTSEVARVHIHTDRPGEVLSLCLGLGSLHQIVIDNMIAQHQELVGSGPAPAGESPASGPELLRDLGVVTVAPGDGLTEVFKSLGADVVIDGGPTMNPSTQDVAEAVTRVNARKVIFLPNNGNIILAAKQAKRLVGRRMYIVPSRTVPQGLAALLALKPDANMGTNLKRAAKAMKQVKTGEVTYAVRQSRFDGHTINPGDVLGLFNGTIKVVGADADQVLYDLLGVMVGERDEIITVFYGSEVPEERASAVGSEVAGRFDFLDVEVRRGGQELYYYIVAVE